MPINILYQKRDFSGVGNSQRAVFVDEKHLEEIELKIEDDIDKVIKNIQEFVSRFNQLSAELKLGNEIKSASDFFNAKYLQQPEYNFHEKSLQLRKLLNILMSKFISNVLAVIRKVEGSRQKSEAEINLEITKIKRLEAISKRLTGGDFKLLEPRIKSWTEFGFKTKEEFYKSEEYYRLLAQHQDELASFRKKLRSKVEEFGESIADSEEAIKEIRKISESIIRGEDYARKNGYAISKRLGFLALRNADTDKKTIILRESTLEDEILHLLDEFERSKQLIQQQYEGSGNFGGTAFNVDNYQFRVKLLERISWLRRAILNLLVLYVEDISKIINIEAVLEAEEMQILYKTKTYLQFFSKLPQLFREIFQTYQYAETLRGIAINVNVYSRESLKWEIFGEEELEWLSGELRRLDYLFSAQEDLTSKLTQDKQQPEEISKREKLIDIIPREVRIQGAAGVVISGDLYLKDVNYKPKVGIIALHGLMDTRRVYYSLSVRAANMGFLVYCPDLPSHGHPSEGTFRFGATSESMLLVIRHLKENYGVEKIGVIGWSLGSMVALFELMHYTTSIENYLERFDKILSELSGKHGIRYEKLFSALVTSGLPQELEYYPDELDSALKNINSKKDKVLASVGILSPIGNYIIKCEEFFSKERILVKRLMEVLDYLKRKTIEFKKYNSIRDFNDDLIRHLNNLKSHITINKIPDDLINLKIDDIERPIPHSDIYREIYNLCSSCCNMLRISLEVRSKIMNYIDNTIQKMRIAENDNENLDSLRSAYREEARSLILSEYRKYEDCVIDAMMILTPVDFTQIFFPLLHPLKRIFDKKFPAVADVYMFFLNMKLVRKFYEIMPDWTNPPGTRFYFRKNPRIKDVKDFGETSNPNFNQMDMPLQARALKIWKPEELRYFLISPSQVVYFGLLVELCPEIVAEVRKVPKVAVYAENDSWVKMRKRGADLIKIFEGFGNMKTIVLKEMGHDLDYNGDGHNLYIEPALIKHFYDFFLLVAQQ